MSTVLYYLLKNECIKLFELLVVETLNSIVSFIESDGDQAAYFCVHSLAVLMAWASFCFQS